MLHPVIDQRNMFYDNVALVKPKCFFVALSQAPLLANLQTYDGFHSFLKKPDAFTDFRKKAFTSAFNRAKARKELKGLLVK